MQYYTFTSWQQVLDWIRENGLVRWCFAAERDKDGKMSQYVVISDWYPGNLDEKIATTRKMLEQQQGRYLYGTGWHNDNKSGGEVSCEVMLAAGQGVNGFPMMMPGMQYAPQAQPVGDLERQKIIDETRKAVLAEVERREYEKEKAAFEKEKAEFEKDKETAIGLAIGYAKPLLTVLKDKMALSNVAGTARDARRPVTAKAIQPITPEESEQIDPDQHDTDTSQTQEQVDGILDNNPNNEPGTNQEDPFTDEEGEKLAELMARFKAVEPDYLQLLESVVEMAEKGDSTYTMAKGFLLK